MSDLIDWSNGEIEQLALELNNIGLHLRNAVACMYNTCTRLANNRFWTGYNFNIVAELMNGYVEKYNEDASYFFLEVPNLILKIAEIQAMSGGGTISSTIRAEGDRDWLIQKIPITQVNASGDQILNVEEVDKFLEDPGTAVSFAFFVHGSENSSIKNYLTKYMNIINKFYDALKKTEAIEQAREIIQIEQGKMMYHAEHLCELIRIEATKAKQGIEDTNKEGIEEAKRALDEKGITIESTYAVNGYKVENEEFVIGNSAANKGKLDLNGDGYIDYKDKRLFEKYPGNYGAHTEEEKQKGLEQFEDAMEFHKKNANTKFERIGEYDKNKYDHKAEAIEEFIKDQSDDNRNQIDLDRDGKISAGDLKINDGYCKGGFQDETYSKRANRINSINGLTKEDIDYNNDGKIDEKDLEILQKKKEKVDIKYDTYLHGREEAEKRYGKEAVEEVLHADTTNEVVDDVVYNKEDSVYSRDYKVYTKAQFISDQMGRDEPYIDANKNGKVDMEDWDIEVKKNKSREKAVEATMGLTKDDVDYNNDGKIDEKDLEIFYEEEVAGYHETDNENSSSNEEENE